jgi:hypothetical protein
VQRFEVDVSDRLVVAPLGVHWSIHATMPPSSWRRYVIAAGQCDDLETGL